MIDSSAKGCTTSRLYKHMYTSLHISYIRTHARTRMHMYTGIHTGRSEVDTTLYTHYLESSESTARKPIKPSMIRSRNVEWL